MNAPGPLSGPLWAVLGRLGAFVGGPGPSWVRSWVLCWRSCAALGVYVGGLGPHVGGLGALWERMLAVLAALGASVGGPGPSWAEKSPRTWWTGVLKNFSSFFFAGIISGF